MSFLQILAVTLQLLDGANTCSALQDVRFREANPIFGPRPDCRTILAVKTVALTPMFILPKGKWKTAFTIGNIAGGGIGLSFSIYSQRKVER